MIRAFLTLALGVALAAPAGAQTRTRIDTTFAFDKSGTVMLTVGTGDIRVTAWARNEIRVVGASMRIPITSSFSPRRVTLESHARSGSGRVQYDVTVPIGVRVVAKAGAGSINISGTRGELSVIGTSATVDASETGGRTEIESAVGRVRLQRLSGMTSVSTLSAPISVTEIEGDLDLSTVSGDVHVASAELANLDFKSTTGDLDFAGTLDAKGRHSIQENSGQVTLRLPPAFGANLEIGTTMGKFYPTDFSVTLQPSGTPSRNRAPERREFTLNGGGATISVKTFRGDVFLRKLGATPQR